MAKSFRLGVIAALLAAAAFVSSPNLRGQPGQAKKGEPLLPSNGKRQLGAQAAEEAESALVKSRFEAGGILTYKPLQGEQLFAWQLKPNLGAPVERPRDLLIMVANTASQAGVNYVAAQQLAEAMVKNAGPNDRVSIWMVSTPDEIFTQNLTRNFIDPKKNEKQIQDAFKKLADQYPAGDCDLKSALAKAIDTFEANEDRQQAILYIGDGQSNAGPIGAADRTALTKKMVERKIAFFPVPMGVKLDPNNLHGFATGTGGIVIRVALLQDKAPIAVARIQQTLAVPILYPTRVQMPAEVVEFFPTKLPPLRSDAPTLVIGKMTAAKQMAMRLEGVVAGRPGKFSCKIADAVPEEEPDNYFLVSMVNQWKNAKDQPALIQANRVLVFAYETNRIARDGFLGDANLAMHRNDLEAAALLYKEVVKMAPHDREAREGLKLIDGIKNGKVDRKELLKQINDAQRKVIVVNGKKEFARLSPEELAKLNQQNDAIQPGKGPDQGKWAEDALKAHRDRIIIEEQLLSQQVEGDIKTAMKELQKDPEGAHERVRSALLRVKDHPDLSDAVRDSLLKHLESTLRTVAMQGAQYKLRNEQSQAAVADALARRDKIVLEKTEMDNFESRYKIYKSLLNDARYNMMERQRLTDEIMQGMLKIQEDARIKALAVPPASQAAYTEALTGYHLQMQNDLRILNERNFLAIMLEVEKSHVPLPDEPPIHFMTRLPASQQLKAWEMLSARRKMLYENADFFSDAKTRKEADDLSKMLDMTIDTKALQQQLSLKDAFNMLYDVIKAAGYGKKGGDFELPILIDAEAFKADDPAVPSIYDAQVAFPPFPSKMAIKTAIRYILSNVPTKNATYVIRHNYIEVTTDKRQYTEKALRVYPVGDLVIPVAATTNPFVGAAGAAGAAGVAGVAGAAGAAGVAGVAGANRGIQGVQGGLGAVGQIGGGFGQIGGGFGQLGGGFGQIGGGGFGQIGGGGFGQIGGGGFGQIGGGFGQIGGGFGQIGGGFGQIGGGFGQIGGGIGQLGGGFGQIGGGFGQLGGGIGALGGGGLGALGGGLYGGLGAGGLAGAQIPGQNCLGFNQFNGGLGAVGTSGLDQGLILLIRQVVAPGEWGGPNCRLQFSGSPLGGIGALGALGGGFGAGVGALGAGGLGVGGIANPGAAGLGGFPTPPDQLDPKNANNIAFYAPALALVVQGTARKHYKDNGGMFGGSSPKPPAVATLEEMRQKPGVIVVDGNKNGKADVAGAKKREGEEKSVAQLDPRKIWQDALANGLQNPGLVIATADFLFDEEEFVHAAEFLKANLRNGVLVEPWVYEALAIALEFSGGVPEEIQRARLSAISLNPQDANSYVKAAKACAEQGQFDRALAFCKQAAQLEPGLPSAYAEALVFAEKSKDVKGMEWAVTKVVGQDWAGDNQTMQLKANKNFDKLVGSLVTEKRNDEAAKLKATIQKLKQRDLVINLSWEAGASGDADLELEITEPTGTVCSSQYRMTPGGGTLSGLTLNTLRKATYAASQAFSGEYKVNVKRLWGQPAGGKFRLEIVQHQGTPQEKRRIETVTLDQKSTMKFVLADGRRTDLAKVPAVALRSRESKDEDVKTEHVLFKLRQIADPVASERLPRGVAGYISNTRGSTAPLPKLPTKKQAEQLVFQGGSSSGGDGVFLTTQGHLSADGQYLRLSVNPVFQPSALANTRPQMEMPLIPGAGQQ